MDVVFEEMIELIWEGVNGTIDGLCNAVPKSKGEGGLVASGKRDELQFAEIVSNLEL